MIKILCVIIFNKTVNMKYQEIVNYLKTTKDKTPKINGITITKTASKKILLFDNYIQHLNVERIIEQTKRKMEELCSFIDNFNYQEIIHSYCQEFKTEETETATLYINWAAKDNEYKNCHYYNAEDFINVVKNNFIDFGMLNVEIGVCIENYVKKRVYTYCIPKNQKVLYESENINILDLKRDINIASYEYMLEDIFKLPNKVAQIKSTNIIYNTLYVKSIYSKIKYFDNENTFEKFLLTSICDTINEENIPFSNLRNHIIAGICHINEQGNYDSHQKLVDLKTFPSNNMSIPIPKILRPLSQNIIKIMDNIFIENAKIDRGMNLLGNYVEIFLNHKNITSFDSQDNAKEFFSSILKSGKTNYDSVIINGILYNCVSTEFFYEGRTLIRENCEYEDIIGDPNDRKWIKFRNSIFIPEQLKLKYSDNWDNKLSIRIYISECKV